MSDTATNDVAAATPSSDPATNTAALPSTTPTDAPPASPAMPDTSFFLDGDAPRLGSKPVRAPAPEQRPTPVVDPVGNVPIPDGAPTLPVVSPVLTSPTTAQAPDQTSMPTLPSPTAEPPAASDEAASSPSEPQHPMAHLMPTKSQPSEAQKRAAELRAAKKAKARKIKLGVAGGFLVVSVVVGPPLFAWLSDAVNEAGNTSSEEPAE